MLEIWSVGPRGRLNLSNALIFPRLSALVIAIVALGTIVSQVWITPGLTAESGGQLRQDVLFDSPILGRKIRAAVYLPAALVDGKEAQPRVPVIYLLHGLGDNHTAWPRLGRIKPTLDRLIASGDLQPVIVVMPDAASSWYVNDVRPDGYGRVFDAFRSDLITAVDARYPAVACSRGRAIGGLSMGGYGALLLGIAQPHLFAAIFSLSGAVFPENLSNDPARRT